MTLPTDVKECAIAPVAAYCAAKIPAEHSDKIRIDYKVRGNTITLYEHRPPWRDDLGPEWTSMRICVFEWDPAAGAWTLHAIDRNERRINYPFTEQPPDLMPLLRELDSDPASIFWG